MGDGKRELELVVGTVVSRCSDKLAGLTCIDSVLSRLDEVENVVAGNLGGPFVVVAFAVTRAAIARGSARGELVAVI